MSDTGSSHAFVAIFQTIQQLKAAHAAQERRNAEALKKAKAEIEAMLNNNPTDVQEPCRRH